MSNAPVKKVSPRDIQTVQNLIERCLQLYMNQREVVETLMVQAKIEPGFTELVWQKLEEENRDFFKAYYLRLMVKQQINEFNKLLEQQVRLMHQVNQSSVASMPISNGPPSVASLPLTNGSHMTPLHLNSAFYAPEQTGTAIKAETSMHQSIGSGLGGAFTGDNSALQPCMHPTVELPTQPSRDDTVSNLVTMQNSNVGMIHGLNGGTIKSEACYSGTPPYIFGGADGSVLDARQSVVDASVASFSSAESNSQALNESFIDEESHSYGFLSSIPRNFSLTDLSADFTQSSDILENYPRSPFLAAEPDNFLDCHEREPQDHKRLDTISESMSFDDFGSE